MTEPDWRSCEDQAAMLWFLRDSEAGSDRKLRLFAVARCRGVFNRLPDDRSRRALEVSEQFADGSVGVVKLGEAYDDAYDVFVETDVRGGKVTAASAAAFASSAEDSRLLASQVATEVLLLFGTWPYRWVERRRQSDLLRCIFGNPFRPMTADPSWLSSTVVYLATGIYQEEAFDRYPYWPMRWPTLAARTVTYLATYGGRDHTFVAVGRSTWSSVNLEQGSLPSTAARLPGTLGAPAPRRTERASPSHRPPKPRIAHLGGSGPRGAGPDAPKAEAADLLPHCGRHKVYL